MTLTFSECSPDSFFFLDRAELNDLYPQMQHFGYVGQFNLKGVKLGAEFRFL